MEPTGLFSLPIEVLHHIGKFLHFKDVLACSATCHYLRYAFNNNIVWKKYLPKKFTLDLKCQELLEPMFCLEETLTPLCENRVTFIKKTNLVNNWKYAKFVKNSTKTSDLSSFVYNISIIVGQAIYKDRYLFLGRFKADVESDVIEVWDINNKPTLLMDQIMNELYYEQMHIVGDCLVVVECVQVKVYEINIPDKSLPLLFSFLITDNEVVFHEPVNHSWRHDERCDGWNYSIVDHYLFANKCDNEPYTCGFYIWDLVNACRVGEFFPPIMGFSIKYHSHNGSNWFLCMKKQSVNDWYFFQFDFKKRSFCEEVFKTDKLIYHDLIYKSYVILFQFSECNSEGWCDTVCSVYDFSTSERLKERRLNNARKNYQIGSTKVINGQFVMLCIDAFHVIDAITLETLQKFPCEDLDFVAHQLTIHGSVFILAANKGNRFQVWDLSKKEKILKDIGEVNTSCLFLNNSCTKLAFVTHNEITVYHFL